MKSIKLLSTETGEQCSCCDTATNLNDVAYGLASDRAEEMEDNGEEIYWEKFQDMIGKAQHETLDCPIDEENWSEVGYFFNSSEKDCYEALNYLTKDEDMSPFTDMMEAEDEEIDPYDVACDLTGQYDDEKQVLITPPCDREGVVCWLLVKSNPKQREWLISYYKDRVENELYEQ